MESLTIEAAEADPRELEDQIRAFYDRAQKSEAARQHSGGVDWRMVVESSNDAFLCVDASGVIHEWSTRAEELFGWPREEVIGQRLEETIFPDDGDAQGSGGIRLLTLAGQEGRRLEIAATTRDGHETPVEVSMSMMQRGGAILFNAFIHDITARRQLQAQLAHGQKLESIGQLSAGIAHEINTPTQYVGDNTRFLRDALDDVFAVLDAYAGLTTAARAGDDPAKALAAVDRAVEAADLDYLATELRDSVDQTLVGV
ncbi:MAG: PAS domain S-box protein, partial [Planctomycetota bacterium]